jgi:CRP-like cAMP-binding protein
MVRSETERKRCAEFLGAVPGFTARSQNELEQFVAEHASEVSCPAGAVVTQNSQGESRLILLLSGTAVLTTSDEIETALVPGDYFGGSSASRNGPPSTVTAIGDVHALVIGRQAFQSWSSMHADHRRAPTLGALRSTTKRAVQRRRRQAVLVGSGG